MVSTLAGRSLHFAYGGGAPAVADVTLELRAGELLVVLGPNGSGKSTLLRLLAGLLAPGRGEVVLDGAPLASLGPRARALRIAVVPQALAALPETTVERFVLGGRYARIARFAGPTAADDAAVRAALDGAGLRPLADRRLGELSGGQLQRVLLARAVAQEAGVLLVDEPTASLDLGHQVHAFERLAQLARAGRAVLVVTHDVNLAAQFATRVVLLAEARLAAQGGVEELLRAEVLGPVYGENLHFGRLPDGTPFVIPASRAP